MKGFLKKLVIFLVLELLILSTSFIYYNKVTLRSYIDISFYFSSVLLLCSLFIYVIHSGFFDVVTKGFTKAFTRRLEKQDLDDIRPLSQLVALNQKSMLLYGLMVGISMLIGLLVYYV